jgi:hypothetical protein
VVFGPLIGEAAGQPTSKGANGLECVAEMDIPVYGGVIWQARVTGQASAVVTIGKNGIPLTVEVGSPHEALTNWLKWWFSKSRFQPRCAGQSIELRLVYRQEGEANAEPRNQVKFRSPNTFEIIANPPLRFETVN